MRGTKIFLVVLTMFVNGVLFAASSDSILNIRKNEKGNLVKGDSNTARNYYATEIAQKASGQIEQIQYRGYVINLHPTGNGEYELQIYTAVRYGQKVVNSIFTSQFQSTIDYSYSYDKQNNAIRQDHFIFPANSLTGWANAEDFVLMKRFDWQEKFPSTHCDRPISTNEEYGREYLEASCLPGRDAALRFAQKFINYVLSNRGL